MVFWDDVELDGIIRPVRTRSAALRKDRTAGDVIEGIGWMTVGVLSTLVLAGLVLYLVRSNDLVAYVTMATSIVDSLLLAGQTAMVVVRTR